MLLQFYEKKNYESRHAKNFDNVTSFLFVLPTNCKTSAVEVNETRLLNRFFLEKAKQLLKVAAETASAMILTSILEAWLIT